MAAATWTSRRATPGVNHDHHVCWSVSGWIQNIPHPSAASAR